MAFVCQRYFTRIWVLIKSDHSKTARPTERFFLWFIYFNPMKKSLITLFFLLPFVSFAQQAEIESITQTVNLYFEGMMERDAAKLEQAFLPDAKLIGYRGDQLFVTPFAEWAAGTAKGSPRDPGQFSNEIKAIRIVGDMALAETELYWPGIYYYDFLTLIKVGERWKIVHKSWTEKKLSSD